MIRYDTFSIKTESSTSGVLKFGVEENICGLAYSHSRGLLTIVDKFIMAKNLETGTRTLAVFKNKR